MKKRKILLASAMILPMAVLSACYDSGSSTSSTNTSQTQQTGVEKSSLTVSASFPGSGNVGAALIDEDTTKFSIRIRSFPYGYDGYYDYNGYYSGYYTEQTAELTPQSPNHTFANLVPGQVIDIRIQQIDANGNVLDRYFSSVKLVEGVNKMVATMIRGVWTMDSDIKLNKTLAGSAEILQKMEIRSTAESGIYPYYNSYYGTTSGDEGFTVGGYYTATWKGSGLYNWQSNANDLSSVDSYLEYFNKFVGIDQNSNMINEGEIDLTPITDTTAGTTQYRYAMLLGLPFTATGETVSDTSINDYMNTKVTAYNRIEGNLAEILEKSEDGYCVDDAGVKTLCPWETSSGTGTTPPTTSTYSPTSPTTSPTSPTYSPASVGMASISTAAQIERKLKHRMLSQKLSGLGKASADGSGCFRDLSISSTYSGTSSMYDPNTGSNQNVPYTFKEVWTGDVCMHEFKATGTQLPATDANVVIQKR